MVTILARCQRSLIADLDKSGVNKDYEKPRLKLRVAECIIHLLFYDFSLHRALPSQPLPLKLGDNDVH